MTGALTIDSLPMPLRWRHQPAHLVAGRDAVGIGAGAHTDLFADPGEPGSLVDNAPAALGIPPGPPTGYRLSARVTPRFAEAFDAGVLLLHAGDRTWAKLCFEYSPQRQPTLVSVVTRGVSDDCNSFPVDGPHVWLRIAGHGSAYAFHASTDGAFWHLVRYFALDGEPAAVGFLAQSPTGPGCTVDFDDIRFVAEPLVNLRDGS